MKIRRFLLLSLLCGVPIQNAAAQQPEIYDPSKAAFWQERKINALAARVANQPTAPTADEIAAKILEKQQREQTVTAARELARQLIVSGRECASWLASNKTAVIPPRYFESARAVVTQATQVSSTLRSLHEVPDREEIVKQLDAVAYDLRLWIATLDKK